MRIYFKQTDMDFKTPYLSGQYRGRHSHQSQNQQLESVTDLEFKAVVLALFLARGSLNFMNMSKT